jgi:hypothetical protein
MLRGSLTRQCSPANPLKTKAYMRVKYILNDYSLDLQFRI